MEPAELLDHVLARPQVQVVRVPEDHVRPELAHLVRVEALDGRLRPDRHERRRGDLAVGGADDAGARRAVRRLEAEAHGLRGTRGASIRGTVSAGRTA